MHKNNLSPLSPQSAPRIQSSACFALEQESKVSKAIQPRRQLMKKLFMPILAACLMFSLAAVAQDTMAKPDTMGKDDNMGKSSMSAPLKTLKGTVKAEGDKITFINDADQKAWDVMNPEKLKAHDGHHVQIT